MGITISTRNEEYKGMNRMNSTKVNEIKDKVDTHMQTYYLIYTYKHTYIHKRMFIVGACRGVARQHVRLWNYRQSQNNYLIRTISIPFSSLPLPVLLYKNLSNQ